MFNDLIDRFQALTDRVRLNETKTGWATVSNLNPLQITLNDQNSPVTLSPSTVYKPSRTGERVFYLYQYRRYTLLGSSEGVQIPDPVLPAIPEATTVISGAITAANNWTLLSNRVVAVGDDLIYCTALLQRKTSGWGFTSDALVDLLNIPVSGRRPVIEVRRPVWVSGPVTGFTAWFQSSRLNVLQLQAPTGQSGQIGVGGWVAVNMFWPVK